jgi:hypothetical protein
MTNPPDPLIRDAWLAVAGAVILVLLAVLVYIVSKIGGSQSSSGLGNIWTLVNNNWTSLVASVYAGVVVGHDVGWISDARATQIENYLVTGFALALARANAAVRASLPTPSNAPGPAVTSSQVPGGDVVTVIRAPAAVTPPVVVPPKP